MQLTFFVERYCACETCCAVFSPMRQCRALVIVEIASNRLHHSCTCLCRSYYQLARVIQCLLGGDGTYQLFPTMLIPLASAKR